MNKYVFPASEEGDLFIHTVTANSLEEAKAEIIKYYDSIYYDLSDSESWEDFIELLADCFTFLGEIYELPYLVDESFEINVK